MNQHKGMALVYVLALVGALGGALALASIELNRQIQHTHLLLDRASGRQMSMAPLLLVQSLLNEDLKRSPHDGAYDNWWGLQTWQNYPIEGGEIRLRLSPLDQRLSVNHLFTDTRKDASFQRSFEKQLRGLRLPSGITDQLIDWVDPDSSARPQGREAAVYRAQRPYGYTPANTEENTYSFLRLLPEWSATLDQTLRENIGLIPRDMAYNVNTLDEEALRLLFPQAQRLSRALASRNNESYTSVSDFFGDAVITDYDPEVHPSFGTRTNQFALEAVVTYHGVVMRYLAYLDRSSHTTQVTALVRQF